MPRLPSFNKRWAVKPRYSEIHDLLTTYSKDVYQLDFFQILEASLTRKLYLKWSLSALSMSLSQFEKPYIHDYIAVFI